LPCSCREAADSESQSETKAIVKAVLRYAVGAGEAIRESDYQVMRVKAPKRHRHMLFGGVTVNKIRYEMPSERQAKHNIVADRSRLSRGVPSMDTKSGYPFQFRLREL